MTTDQQQPQAGEINLEAIVQFIEHYGLCVDGCELSFPEQYIGWLIATVARQAEQIEHPVVHWALAQTAKGRRLVALIPPTEAHDGPRYAGYYCEDGPDPAAGLEAGQ